MRNTQVTTHSENSLIDSMARSIRSLASQIKEERVKPVNGTKYWTPDLHCAKWDFKEFHWQDDQSDNEALDQGLVFPTKEACEARVKDT